MNCTNIKCPYYRKASKVDGFEKAIGIKEKQGGCKYPYCKIRKGNNNGKIK